VGSILEGYGGKPHPSLISEHKRLHPDNEGCARVAKLLQQRLARTDTWLDRSQQRWKEIRELPQVFIAL